VEEDSVSGALGATRTITLDLQPVNDAPMAANDFYTLVHADNAAGTLTVPLAQGVLANDTDPDGPARTAQLVTNVAIGTLSLQADGSFTYTAPGHFFGTQTFAYRMYDGQAYSEVATATIIVAMGLQGGVLSFGNAKDVADLSGVPLQDISTVSMGNGKDDLVTSWQHVGATTTYRGDNGDDDIRLVFSVAQLEQVLSDTGYRGRLKGFLDNESNGLDLSGSFWNAKVHTDFETATASVWSGGKWTDLGALLNPMPTSTTSGSGDDVLVGAGSGDTLTGQAGDDILLGLGGDDSLVGAAGVDLILGGDGLDTILGGLGGDILSGGAGSDRFTYLAGDLAGGAVDRILDFGTGASGDIIDLGGLLDGAFGLGSAEGDFARATVSGTDITVQVNLGGTTSGNWQDVAVLQGAATAGADMIRLYFEGQERPVTV
jgi:Ca2+-binding RTX toxin-like protein